ncbi:WLM-domain-containing protein [Pseudovirgaria hyperparasitica]|uniref:WLM-domain-containing protein n=1 Tax=Pseudovirgaria hyperparasitica TaxID=470096 RepID=A0A6A6W5R3_9PEZI|nr:WLM-domain-containing protein [Pseudovirgaria hyperparasitica]KAF2758222.1 WLM-domain-containing protein [Pseudovirgaria hyperparasitica]
MPLGFERLNERTTRPNPLINFIKPLPGPSSTTAHSILSRIAAQCVPVMRTHHIAVMALEEYPPNPEFVGRNFNAGEVIQLVLKDRAGRWLPFRHVQMVMMHELAHCKEMNHSKAFWKVRDAYAGEMRALWERRYTGEGLWGVGRDLNGEVSERDGGVELDVPENLCGGTFRTRRRKRRRGGKGGGKEGELTYAEKKQRRILRKFGAGGVALGADDIKKEELQGGKMVKGKPRVAGSARGRELRAAAALARFDQVKKEEVHVKKEESETESDSDYGDVEEMEDTALDLDGKQMTDSNGHGMVKICEDEDEQDDNAKREMAELYAANGQLAMRKRQNQAPNSPSNQAQPKSRPAATKATKKPPESKPKSEPRTETRKPTVPTKSKPSKPNTTANPEPTHRSTRECPTCSLLNDPGSLTCLACANVLDTRLLPIHWRCQSLQCRGGAYINSGDTGMCGICGAAKPP